METHPLPLLQGSLIRKRPPLGPYSRTMPRLLGGGGGLMSEVPLHSDVARNKWPDRGKQVKHAGTQLVAAVSQARIQGRLKIVYILVPEARIRGCIRVPAARIRGFVCTGT